MEYAYTDIWKTITNQMFFYEYNTLNNSISVFRRHVGTLLALFGLKIVIKSLRDRVRCYITVNIIYRANTLWSSWEFPLMITWMETFNNDLIHAQYIHQYYEPMCLQFNFVQDAWLPGNYLCITATKFSF